MTTPAARTILAAPIRRILLVDEIVRPDAVSYRAESTPGHLIHVVQSGEVRQRAEGRLERFRAGHVVWYHESEPVTGRIVRAPWRFITINFEAPELPPPQDDRRVLEAGPQTLALARRLVQEWRDDAAPGLLRALRCTATLTELLLDFLPPDQWPEPMRVYPAHARDAWWRAEKELRLRLSERFPLAALACLAGLSIRTTIRACHAATGTTPARRLKTLRLAQARGLLQHSDLSITEVAQRVGYARVQELSRDVRRAYGCTPRALRARPPDYRALR